MMQGTVTAWSTIDWCLVVCGGVWRSRGCGDGWCEDADAGALVLCSSLHTCQAAAGGVLLGRSAAAAGCVSQCSEQHSTANNVPGIIVLCCDAVFMD
jgi:hypothetical protein